MPAGPTIEGPDSIAFEQRRAIERARLLHALGPHLDALVLRHGDLVDDLGIAEALLPTRQKLLVGGRLRLLAVVAGDDDAVAFRGGQREVLIADAERRRGERYLLVHARGRPLPVERHVRAADQRGHHAIGLGLLDLGDGRAEVGDVQREEVGLGDRAAALGDVVLEPFGGDLAVVVVGREDVDLLAPFLHGVVDDRLDCLGRCGAGRRWSCGRRRRLRRARCRSTACWSA